MYKNKKNNKNEKDNVKDNDTQEPRNNGWELKDNINLEFGNEFFEEENKNKNQRNHNNDNRSHSNFKHTEDSNPKNK